MSGHDAEYIHQRRGLQGIPEREPHPTAKSIKQGLELKGLQQLSWPEDLFGNNASIAELMSKAAGLADPDEYRDDLCPCGGSGSTTTTCLPYGHSFNVVYFWMRECKGKWNWDRMELGNGSPSRQAYEQPTL